jgi:DNA-directed RNA polymerase subunit RPC12/RpoP
MKDIERDIFCCDCGRPFLIRDDRKENDIVCKFCDAKFMCIDVTNIHNMIKRTKDVF